MAEATLNGQTVTFPDGPYTYDDPRFVYDEPCMFYDGGFSVLCLANLRPRLPRKVGRSTGMAPARRRPKPQEDCRVVLDVVITSAIAKVNDKEIDDEEEVKKYHLDYGPIEVTLHKVKHDEKELNVHMQAITSSISIPKVCVTDPNIKLLPIKTIVSSSKARIKKPKLIFKTETVKKKN